MARRTNFSYDIPYVLALFPDDHWTPKQVEYVMRKHYKKEDLPMGRIYRHLQILKSRGWINRSRYGWHFTQVGRALLDPNYKPPWFLKHNLIPRPNARWDLDPTLMSYNSMTIEQMNQSVRPQNFDN